MSMDIISTNFDKINKILARFTASSPMIASACIVSGDGVVINTTSKDQNEEFQLGAMVAAVDKAAPTIVSELNSTKMISMIFLLDRGGILFYPLPDDLIFCIKLAKPGKIGPLFSSASKLIKTILSLPAG